jgi:hypothetical protein
MFRVDKLNAVAGFRSGRTLLSTGLALLRNQFTVRLSSRTLIYLLALGVAVLITVHGFLGSGVIRRVRSGSGGNPKLARIANTHATPRGDGQPGSPTCPPAGLPALQPSPQNPGHHRVVLSWNANPPSPDPAIKAVGYCLYRSKTPLAAKQNPRCANCEQINSMPIIGTGCVDNIVEDGAAYYYVVTAINAAGKISSSSNETPAPIPNTKAAAGSVPASSYPSCRATTAPQ